MARPRRLSGISYNDRAAYFVTTCTRGRCNAFQDIEFGHEAIDVLTTHSTRFSFAISASCLMPDHAHLLVVAVTGDAPLRELVRTWKQATGYRWHRRHGGRLWQEGYFERVLRTDEPELSVARYIIENPVRGRLVASVADYPLTGSTRYSIRAITEAVQLDYGRSRWRA